MAEPALRPDPREGEREFAFSDEDFRFIADFAKTRVGIAFPAHKKEMVYARLTRRLRALGLSGFPAYRAHLQGPHGGEEIEQLVNAVTTNITSFFREAHHFEHVAEVIVPEILQSGERRLRFWSAGCSLGMEAYSLAATLADALPGPNWDVKILATDIDTSVLEKGRAGLYPGAELEKIPMKLRRFFTRQENGEMQVSEPLRRVVSFKPLNLLEPWPMKGPFDAIFCRNVVIYFDKPTQRTLFARYAQLLKPQGWLYIGHSENLFNVSDAFELTGRTIYRLR